jgi:hypothetical protein
MRKDLPTIDYQTYYGSFPSSSPTGKMLHTFVVVRQELMDYYNLNEDDVMIETSGESDSMDGDHMYSYYITQEGFNPAVETKIFVDEKF